MKNKYIIYSILSIIILIGLISCGKANMSEEAASVKTQKPLSEYKVMGNEYKTTYPFEHFFVFPDSNSIYREQQKISMLISSKLSSTIRVKVTGFLPERMVNLNFEETKMIGSYVMRETGSYASYFKVNIENMYQYENGYHTSDEYMISYVGNPCVQVYRMPMPNIGDDYILLNVPYNEYMPEELYRSFWFKIKKIDGVEYVYPYFVDCGELKNNLPMNDDEALIYYDTDIIKYMKKNNIEPPRFEFKFELNDFIAQVKAIRGN